MSALDREPITKYDLLHTNASMLVATSIFVFLRAVLHVTKRKTFEPQDLFVYLAYVLYICLWSCYLAVIPPIYRFNTLDGEMKPDSAASDDAEYALKIIMAAQTCYFTLLLSVKLSLMTLYRKLLLGLPYIYNKIWWAIVVCCIAAWVGSIISSVFVCDEIHESPSICTCSESASEFRKIIFSLYFSYALDVSTNLMIVLFPIHIIWDLQMTRLQKIGVFFLFGSDFICVIFATLRVIQLGVDGHGRTTIPDPTWMLYWTVIECSIAVMIGCLPTFASLVRAQINNYKTASCTAHRCIQRSIDAWRKRSEASSKFRLQRDNPNLCWGYANESQEELTWCGAAVDGLGISRVSEGFESDHKEFGESHYERRGAEDFTIYSLRAEDHAPVPLDSLRL